MAPQADHTRTNVYWLDFHAAFPADTAPGRRGDG